MIIRRLLVNLIPVCVICFVVASIVLFIIDGIRAKREGRRREKKYVVLFVISMVLIALAVILVILLALLTVAILRSM